MAFTATRKDDDREYDYSSPISDSRSFFGKSMKIDGEITSDEDVTIEGKLTGQLKVSKTLTIGNSGYVNGKISASVVQISGEAEGEVAASEKLEIASHGKYTGNIQAETIVVAEGAKVRGTINMDVGELIKSKAPATPAKPEEPKEKKTEPKSEEKKEA